jgi:hypothetical protein
MVNDSMIDICINSEFGLFSVVHEDSLQLIDRQNIFLGNIELIPSMETDLESFFDSNCIYLGIYDSYLVFEIGRDYDLFGVSIYLNFFKKIDNNRILNIYSPGTARDYNFKNGKWK